MLPNQLREVDVGAKDQQAVGRLGDEVGIGSLSDVMPVHATRRAGEQCGQELI